MWIIDPGQEPLPKRKYSRKLVSFTCQCKHKTNRTMPWRYYASGRSKSCRQCNYIDLKTIKNIRYGKLMICNSESGLASSNKKIKWKCECGSVKSIVLKSVINGLTKSCGCLLANKSELFAKHASTYVGDRVNNNAISNINRNIRSRLWWSSQQFGQLSVVRIDQNLSIGSEKKLQCYCRCGNTTWVRAEHLASGRTRSCGKCSVAAYKWWNQKTIDKYPNSLEELQSFFDGSFLFPISFSKKKPLIKCLVCDNHFRPNFHDLFSARIQSCGCMPNRISKNNLEIAQFLESHEIKCELEKKIGKWSVDVFLPEYNIAIDHHGLTFHSDKFRDMRRVELDRFNIVSSSTSRYLIVFEDEWRFSKSIIKNLLLNVTGNINSTRIRPSKCSIASINYKDICSFYEKYHYLGPRGAYLHIAVFYQDIIVGAMSISKPSRQSSHDWELVRMVRHPNYNIPGIWSKIISMLPSFGIKGSVISFSDNRLFDGRTYEKIGFKFDGLIPRNYYYTNGYKRYHKSKMRKTKDEKSLLKTERELRSEQGLFRIWDYGKTRWKLDLNQ